MAATWLNSQFTIEDAINRGFDTWDLLIEDWGHIDGLNPVALSFPTVGSKGLPSVCGIAIGNQSDVDRCFISYSIEKLTPNNVTWDIAHRLSVKAPLMFPQAGEKEIVQPGASPLVTPAEGKATIVIYPRGTSAIFSNNGGMPNTLWQDDAFPPSGGGPILVPDVNPLLHLVFYLKPPAVGPATRRNDSLVSLVETVLVEPPNFGLLGGRGVPVHGRKTAIVTATDTLTGSPGDDINILVRGYKMGGSTQMVDLASFTLPSGFATRQVIDLAGGIDVLAVFGNVDGDYNPMNIDVQAFDD